LNTGALWVSGSCWSQAVLYAGPAWYGYTTAADRDRIEGFLRWAMRLEYRTVNSPTFDHVISIADDRLFEKVSMDHRHPLHLLLPAGRTHQYNLRRRSHLFCLSKHQSIALTLLIDFYIKVIVITRPDNNHLPYSSKQHLITNCFILFSLSKCFIAIIYLSCYIVTIAVCLFILNVFNQSINQSISTCITWYECHYKECSSIR